MLAAVIEAPEKLIIKDVPEPECAENEIKIKVEAAAICNATDVHIWQGTFPGRLLPGYPHILGHECSGRIVRTGKNVDRQRYPEAARVAFWCKMTGAFAEYNTFNPDDYAVTVIEEGISPEEGAVMELAAGTMRAVYSSGIKPADRVAVLGLGPAGQIFLQEVRAAGAKEVIGIEPLRQRRDLAKDLGIDAVLTPQEASQARYLESVDLVFDAMGDNRGGLNLGLDLLKNHGRYIVFSFATTGTNIPMWKIAHKGIEIAGLGEKADMAKTQDLLEVAKRWIMEKRLNLAKLISHRLTLPDLEKGLQLCKDKPAEVMKVLVVFNK